MCSLCENTQPWTEDCIYGDLFWRGGSPDGGDVSAPMPVYTYDQIADQLTTGYWGSSRSFDVTTGGTLYVDITGLTAGGQAMALQALDAWALVTGLKFVEVDAHTPPWSPLTNPQTRRRTLRPAIRWRSGTTFSARSVPAPTATRWQFT